MTTMTEKNIKSTGIAEHARCSEITAERLSVREQIIENDPGVRALTIEELKQMSGRPVWCPEEEVYGIVMCDKRGKYAGIPFLHGVWYDEAYGIGVEFNHNIIGRKLKCFRIEDKKGIAMPLRDKVDEFGDHTLVCPNCGQSAVVNLFGKGRKIYPRCPWCGQKLKEKE